MRESPPTALTRDSELSISDEMFDGELRLTGRGKESPRFVWREIKKRVKSLSGGPSRGRFRQSSSIFDDWGRISEKARKRDRE